VSRQFYTQAIIAHRCLGFRQLLLRRLRRTHLVTVPGFYAATQQKFRQIMSQAWPYPFWIAHRGAGKRAPENTLAAFREGAHQGFRMFECDVKLSADDVPFLLHDSALERTTSGMGRAGDQPWTALSQLDAGGWHGARHAGEAMPTLAAIARFVLANGLAVNLEIKPTPGVERRTGDVVARAAAQLWAGSAPAPLLSSFDVAALEAAASAVPALPRALLLDELRAGWFDAAQRLACRAVVTHHSLMDAGMVRRLHQAGLRALVYTVNERADLAAMRAAGVDGVITDEVARYSDEVRAAT
jgi:glycerophosphoryl diester phosphodiesterase